MSDPDEMKALNLEEEEGKLKKDEGRSIRNSNAEITSSPGQLGKTKGELEQKSQNLDQHGTTMIGLVLRNKIVVGHDSRSSNEQNIIGSDNLGHLKVRKIQNIFFGVAGKIKKSKAFFKGMELWAVKLEKNTLKIADVVDYAESYLMSTELQGIEGGFRTLIFCIEEEGPVMYLLKSFDKKDFDLQQNTTLRAERIQTITSIGSGEKFLTNELSNYNVEVEKIGPEDYIANLLLKAALFDPHTGGNIYVLTLNVDGTSKRSWSVPKLYLEKFEIAKPWDEKSIFIVCVEERLYPAMAIRDHAKFNKWMNSFSIFKDGDIEICHLIGGFHDDLQRSAVLYRVVLKTQKLVTEFFDLATKSKGGKDVIDHDGWKVHPRHVSEVPLQNLLHKRE